MTYKLISKNLNVHAAESFVESVRTDTVVYAFAAKHTPYTSNSDQIIPVPNPSVKETLYDVYNNMIFGKKVANNDIVPMIPRSDWTSNTVYTMYDDTAGELFNEQFYACVNVGTQTHIYKCLYNNGGAPSIVEPSGTDISPFETPQDGYVWKYMCTSSDVLMNKFATNDYIPIVANSSVVENATSGSIDVIVVENGGLGYNNYLVGEFGTANDIKVGGDPYLYALGPTASSIDDFYNGCLIKITSGNAKDEYRIITNYYLSGGQKIAVLNDTFNGSIVATDTFEVYPYVYVFDTGGVKQTNCIARAIVSNTSGNSIARVEILQAGSGYRSANAVILSSNAVPVTSTASLRAIIPPPGGHGYNANNELGASYVGIVTKFVGDTFTVSNDYRQVGLLRYPSFANVNIKIDDNNTIGAFAVGERIYKYKPVALAGNVAVYSNSTVVGTDTFFEDALTVGDSVIITNGGVGTFANVVGIANNTQLTLSSNALFTSLDCTIELARTEYLGVLSANSAGEIFLSNVAPISISSSMKLVGEESQCTSVVDSSAEMPISINGRAISSFDSFTQLTKFVGTQVGETAFVEDEMVTQGSALVYSTPQAVVHSYNPVGGGADELYCTNVKNVFQTVGSPESDGVIAGTETEAQLIVSAKYDGDLVPESGEVIFMENLHPISRANNQTETIKIVLQF